MRLHKKYCLLSNDVETHSIWYNKLRDETGMKVLKEGMPVLLDIYRRFGIRTTFFFVGDMALKFPEVVRMILPDGHEVASHGWTHEVDQAFDVMSYEMQVDHLVRSKKILEEISGTEVVSFRAPALRVNEHTARALAEAGYRIDSSVASQRFDLFLSFGGIKKLKWLTAPRKPYRTDPADLLKQGSGSLIEVPLTAMIFPFVGTTLRLFPGITFLQQKFFNIETGGTGKPLVFDIHPNEFIEEYSDVRVIARRTSNPVKYLFNDVIRGRLKIKNLGRKAIPLYEKFIEYYTREGYAFTTIRDYVSEQKDILN
jgi:peptidoglycan-N-acetylglucosamine deacetylase